MLGFWILYRELGRVPNSAVGPCSKILVQIWRCAIEFDNTMRRGTIGTLFDNRESYMGQFDKAPALAEDKKFNEKIGTIFSAVNSINTPNKFDQDRKEEALKIISELINAGKNDTVQAGHALTAVGLILATKTPEDGIAKNTAMQLLEEMRGGK